MKTVARFIKVVFALWVVANSPAGWADDNKAQKQTESKAVVIIFNPPEGKEREFLDYFVPGQKAYMLDHAKNRDKPASGLNLIPTKQGDPLIHIVIYADADTFAEAYKVFGAKENRAAYLKQHSGKYGIPESYLQHSKFYVADVVK